MGQLSDKDKIDLNDNKIVVDMEIELLSEKLEMNGESKTGNEVDQMIHRYTHQELIEIGQNPECQKELNNIVIKTLKLSKYDKSEIRERTMSLNRNLNSMESSARKQYVNNSAGVGIYRSKENGDHLILSQHFKSFHMGCHMPSMMHPNVASAFNRDFSGRGRAGSGRILSRDVPWDYRPDETGTNNTGFNFRTGGGGVMGPREPKRDYHRDEKFYSRDREGSYPYNYDHRYTKQYSSSYGDRYSNNYNSHGYDEEPEWFSAGPTSQHDVIELHGFDDDKNRSTHSLKSGKISYSENESSISDLHSELSKNNSSNQTSSHRSSTPTKKLDSNNNESVMLGDDKLAADVPIKHDFNFEDFLKLDSINGFIANDQFARDNQSSRFSKWFRQDSNQKAEDDFADIHDQSSSKHLSASLLNLLQRNDSLVSSKSSSIQSVEEIEAKILQNKEFIPKSTSGSNLQSSNEGLAFKKLLAQIQQNQAMATSHTAFNPNILPAVPPNSNYFNAALLNQQPHLNGLNLMKILSEQQMQFNLQQQQFLQAQQSLIFKQQLQQQNSHPTTIQQAQQQEIYKKLILLDQIQKQQNQMNLSQSNLMYQSNPGQQNRDSQSQYRAGNGNYRKPHASQSHDHLYINRNQMQHQQPQQQQQNYLNQPAFTPTSVRRHLAANNIDNKLSSCNIQAAEQQNNLLNNVNFNALAVTSDRINYDTNMTSGKNREEAMLHQPQLNAKPGRPILKGSQHHVQFAPTNYVQQ